ncbi:MAG: ABC transporter ATP-binding protein/permease [Oscillospiraceae bacterium]|nr:ABC transporter ATP-binding protein/permease [Oscillospiraceae bacterium]
MGGHGPVEKPKDFKATWARLIRYARAYLPAIIISLVAAAFGTTLQILGPDRIKNMTNEILRGLPALVNGVPVMGAIDMGAVSRIAWSLVALYCCSIVLSFAQSYIMATVTQRLTKGMRTDISRKINRLPFRYFDKTSYGDVLSRVTNDVDAIGQTMQQSLGSLIAAITMFIGSLFMMLKTNWIMALTAVGTSFIGFMLMMLIVKRSQKYFTVQQRELGVINGHIEEIYSGHNVVKAYNGGAGAKKTFEAINQKLYRSGWISQFLSGLMMPLMGFVGNLGYVAVCVVGASLAMNGRIEFGVIVAFMIYIRLFTQPLSQIAQAFNNLQRTAAAGERVFEFFDENELPDERHKLSLPERVKGDVEFRHVNFGYVPEKTVIHDFSAEVKAGQKIAIVGPTGAGKTTMVNLLMRFYELDGGEILLDGTPISEVPRENVHEQFCMVLQDTWLFEGTIKENIIYAKQGVTDEDVVSACKTAGLHHFIRTLPDGYDTVLNDKASLSEGQKQLMTIARAMIQNAPLLILDEATSSVDTRTEVIIQEAMDKLTAGRTSFVIAHRLSTIRNADLILVMRGGDIVESGSHEELLAGGGFYAELYNSQFES